MRNKFYAWINRDAQWWQFWLPRSGIFGGAVAGGLLSFILAFLYEHS